MIKDFFKKIKSSINAFHQEKLLRQFINSFTEKEWNMVTSGLISDLIRSGEDKYLTLSRFVAEHPVPIEFFKVFDAMEDWNYRKAIMLQKELTEDQKKLLKACKARKIKSSIIPILESIEEYEQINNMDNISIEDWK